VEGRRLALAVSALALMAMLLEATGSAGQILVQTVTVTTTVSVTETVTTTVIMMVRDVTRQVYPVSSQIAVDALIVAFLLLVAGFSALYSFARRSPVVLLAGGVAVFAISIAMAVFRSTILTEAVIEDGVLRYETALNPATQAYMWLAVVGVFWVAIWILDSLARTMIGRGLIG